MRIVAMLLAALVLSLSVTTPASAAGCNKRGGQVAGGAIGGGIGAWLGKKLGGTGGALIGAVAGGTLGVVLGKKLDRCEQDKVDTATVAAASIGEANRAGEPVAWRSDTRADVHGTAVAKPATVTKDGRQCRQISRVSYIAGEEVRDEPLLCRTPPETAWSAA